MVAPVETRPSLSTSTHALDPLTAQEIAAASAVLREKRDLPSSLRFVSLTMLEPEKAELSGEVGELPRLVFAVLYDRATSQTFEAVVDLGTGVVRSWRELAGVQPGIMLEEFFAAEDLTRADPRWQEAVRRGVLGSQEVVVLGDGWRCNERD